MSFQMPTNARARVSGRFARRVEKELQQALINSGLRQIEVADKLGVDKSIVNRRLTGRANLTIKSIADFAWATDHEIHFSLKPKTLQADDELRQNISFDDGRSGGAIVATVANEPAKVFFYPSFGGFPKQEQHIADPVRVAPAKGGFIMGTAAPVSERAVK